MNKKSKITNVLLSSSVGIIAQILTIFSSFIVRTVFIRVLSADYLGINGLYTNILSVLSLSELGIGNVMIFSLYKPLAEKDEARIATLLQIFKKIYNYIAIGVLLIGISITPLLKIVTKSELPPQQLILYYYLFLAGSVLSYFAVYKSIIINADQRVYTTKIAKLIATETKDILQIILLIVFRNYIAYLLVQSFSTVFENIILTFIANKDYHLGNLHHAKPINAHERREIFSNVGSTFFYKVGTTILNSTDNIIISAILGTIIVGFYSNYLMIIAAIQGFISILISSFIPIIGAINAENSKEKLYNAFNMLLFVFALINTICTVCLYFCIQNVVYVWAGESYLISVRDLTLIMINFYIGNMVNPVWMYREACGLFKNVRYVMLFTSAINIVLSIILGKLLGLGGIVLATGLARILTVVWYEPQVLFKNVFHQTTFNYWIKQSKYLILTIVSTFACSLIPDIVESMFLDALFRAIIYCIIVIVIFSFMSINEVEFISLFQFVSKRIKRERR